MKRFICIALFLLAQSSVVGQAQTASTEAELVSQMNALIEVGRYQDAYILGQTGLFDYEGEPNFDFAYGLAALESGRPDEAVFAFERIAFNNTNQQRVRLELARAYFLSQNYAAAETLFTEALADNPTANVRANVEAFLQLIDQAQSATDNVFSFSASIDTGTDSNINSATELGVIDTPIGDVTLSAGGQEIDDSFTNYTANVGFVRPIDNNRNITLQANYNHKNNHITDQFDLTVGSGQVAYNWGLNSNIRYSHALRLQMVKLDTEKFQSSASLFLGDDNIQNAIARNNETQFVGFALSDQFLLRPGHLLYGRMSVQINDHGGPDPIFNITRTNSTSSASFGWIWQLLPNLVLTTDYTYIDNESNIDLYSYDRNRFQTGLRLQF